MGCTISLKNASSEFHDLSSKVLIKNETIEIIQDSWKKYNEANTLAEHGINMVIRLFLVHSEIRYIWKFGQDLQTEEEMRKNSRLKYHGKRIMETIGIVVKSLNNLDVLDVLLVELGSRHFTYGTKADHFVYVKEAFIYVFKNALGSNFTTEVSDAWDLAFQYIAKKMLEGMGHSSAI